MENGFENIEKDGSKYYLQGKVVLYNAAVCYSITNLFVSDESEKGNFEYDVWLLSCLLYNSLMLF